MICLSVYPSIHPHFKLLQANARQSPALGPELSLGRASIPRSLHPHAAATRGCPLVAAAHRRSFHPIYSIFPRFCADSAPGAVVPILHGAEGCRVPLAPSPFRTPRGDLTWPRSCNSCTELPRWNNPALFMGFTPLLVLLLAAKPWRARLFWQEK